MDTNEEKRKISRVDYTIKAQAKYKGRDYIGEINNFSLNGFLFCTHEVMDAAEGDEIIIAINLADGAQDVKSEINCTVVRKVINILGLNFDVIDFDTLMFLRERLININGDQDKINDEFINFVMGN